MQELASLRMYLLSVYLNLHLTMSEVAPDHARKLHHLVRKLIVMLMLLKGRHLLRNSIDREVYLGTWLSADMGDAGMGSHLGLQSLLLHFSQQLLILVAPDSFRFTVLFLI